MVALPREKLVLAIDPGPNKAGFAVLTVTKPPKIIESAQVDLGADRPLGIKLRYLYETTLEWINRYRPCLAAVAMESWCKPYDEKWLASELAAEARAAVRIAAAARKIPVIDYNPNAIKEQLTSLSKASKEQVRAAVRIHLDIDHDLGEDEADALAVGLVYCWNKTGVSRWAI